YVSIFIVLGVVSVAASFIPERVTFLSGIRKCIRLLLMVLIVFFCAWALALLNDVRSRMQVPDYYIWRYLSLLVAFTIIGIIIKFRNSSNFARYHILSDLIAAIAIIKIVSAEIRYLTSISSDFDQNGICITLWFGISALALFLMGFWLKLKHLRILGFVMSGVTVVKLFFYDVWNSELWVKAILFVAVGAIFMLVSFIYTKYLKKDSDEQIVGDK
ncbi:MAG: DUF2339 domain-containing protein, partial [Alphaproteobacteria bacterium]|nr:DUF2339 domain-containing protein [Alphaproteobacteria bacterium]